MGGAQAIAAMAYGTESVPRCDIVIGPGNLYVAAAKKEVRDFVAVDYVAGPTELVILSDGSSPPRLVASEMVAQAEHDPHAMAILITMDDQEPARVIRELEQQVQAAPRREIITKSLQGRGWAILAASLDEAWSVVHAFAPEHLLVATSRPEEALSRIDKVGAASLGIESSVAFADYGTGPNHILPTMGWAARGGALSANTFIKAIPYQRLHPTGAGALRELADLADLEGLNAHARAMRMRTDS
jgi:histidinol dehydrogenase